MIKDIPKFKLAEAVNPQRVCDICGEASVLNIYSWGYSCGRHSRDNRTKTVTYSVRQSKFLRDHSSSLTKEEANKLIVKTAEFTGIPIKKLRSMYESR